MEKKDALIEFLTKEFDYKIEEFKETNWGSFEVDDEEWMIGTYNELYELLNDNAEDLLFYFNSDFLETETGIPAIVYETIQKEGSGDAMEAVKILVEKTCGVEDFLTDAIATDGFGHLMGSYDGNTYEFGDYYIYRV